MKGSLLINVFIVVLFEVALAICPGWCGCWRVAFDPFSGGSLKEGNSVKVSSGCPDESCFSDGDISGLEEILALLLALEVLCHCHCFIKGFVKGFHDCADIIGFEDVIVEFHVLDEGEWGDIEHEFIIFIIEVSYQFSWNCLFHVLQACLDEVVLVGEELKSLII